MQKKQKCIFSTSSCHAKSPRVALALLHGFRPAPPLALLHAQALDGLCQKPDSVQRCPKTNFIEVSLKPKTELLYLRTLLSHITDTRLSGGGHC